MFHNLVDFTKMWDFTWRVSDCEELVGVTHRRRKKKEGEDDE
jgi:hypothetical protein